MMLKQTKIVASISDERCEVEFIRDLFKAGMNVVRMNTAHASREGFEKLIRNVREVSNRIAILMDTKGPEVRTTAITGGEPIPYKIGDRVKIVGNPNQETTRECIAVSYPGFVHDLQVDGDILIDDGDLELRVVDKTDEYLVCEVQNEATLGNRKSVNVPGVRINLPSLTEKDRNNILYAIEKDIDYIAHSFVRNKQDVLDIRQILDTYGSDIKIIAKIENQEGVDNIDEILEVADGVMVARGDLGIEVPQERIPGIQRMLIRKCILAKKPVIVATQMLHTMINNPRPTRAEVTDIANAIYYRTDALMLSGETAYGKYPVEAVKTMTKVAAQAEKDKLSENDIRIPLDESSNDVTAFLAKQAVKATSKLKIRAIITDSFSGRTARNIAAFRGKYPVLAICYKEKTMRHLALSYGVEAIYMPEKANGQAYYFAALRKLLDDGVLCESDMVAYLSSGKQGQKALHKAYPLALARNFAAYGAAYAQLFQLADEVVGFSHKQRAARAAFHILADVLSLRVVHCADVRHKVYQLRRPARQLVFHLLLVDREQLVKHHRLPFRQRAAQSSVGRVLQAYQQYSLLLGVRRYRAAVGYQMPVTEPSVVLQRQAGYPAHLLNYPAVAYISASRLPVGRHIHNKFGALKLLSLQLGRRFHSVRAHADGHKRVKIALWRRVHHRDAYLYAVWRRLCFVKIGLAEIFFYVRYHGVLLLLAV